VSYLLLLLMVVQVVVVLGVVLGGNCWDGVTLGDFDFTHFD